MDDLITSRYTVTPGDFVEMCVANHRYAWRSSSILKFARVFFGGIILLGIGGWLATKGQAMVHHPLILLRDLPGPILMLGLLAYLFHPRNFLNRLWYRYHFRVVAEASRSIEWGFDPEILWLHTPLAEATYRWEMFPILVETPACFLFYQGQRALSLWLPSRAFSSPGMLRTFTDLARTKVPNYVVLGECRFPAKPEPVGLDEL